MPVSRGLLYALPARGFKKPVAQPNYIIPNGDFGSMPDKETLDCLGLYCPVPVMQLREKMDSLPVGATLEVFADDPAAEEDFKRWAKRMGQELLEFGKDGSKLRFLFRKVK